MSASTSFRNSSRKRTISPVAPPLEKVVSGKSFGQIDKTLISMFNSKIAIVQAGSLLYNTKGTIEKLEKAVIEAAGNGAHLILFPEAFIGGYPKALTFGISMGKRSSEGRDEFKKYYEAAIEYDGPESNQIGEIARTYGVNIVVGVVERDGGTLYCSVCFYSYISQNSHISKVIFIYIEYFSYMHLQ